MGPVLAGEPGAVGALVSFAACLPREPVGDGPGVLAGADFRNHVEIPLSYGSRGRNRPPSALRARGGGAPGTVNGLRSVREAKQHPRWSIDLKPAVVKDFRRIIGTAGIDNPGALEAFAFITDAQR